MIRMMKTRADLVYKGEHRMRAKDGLSLFTCRVLWVWNETDSQTIEKATILYFCETTEVYLKQG